MNNFNVDIENYKRYGTYNYNFDGVGNLTFNNASSNFNQNYIAFPLNNIIYNKSKIESIYDVNFNEFIVQSQITSSVSTEELIYKINMVENENQSLRNELNNIINSSDLDINSLAIKQVIIELRISLGEGKIESDFSNTFPYTAIRKEVT